MFRRRMAPPDSTLVADAADTERQRARAVLNRFIFRGMLFSMGSIAVVLHRVLPSKTVAWEFAKFSARNLARACGVRCPRDRPAAAGEAGAANGHARRRRADAAGCF